MADIEDIDELEGPTNVRLISNFFDSFCAFFFLALLFEELFLDLEPVFDMEEDVESGDVFL
jgi:hypothetical protein